MNFSFGLKNLAMLFILIALCTFFAVMNPIFMNSSNLLNILRQVSILGIVSVGMALTLITGGIDLSVGSIIGLAGVICAKLMVIGFHPVLAVLIALSVGIIVGMANGFTICKVNIPPLIATLAMLTIVRGVIYVLTGAWPIYGFTESFRILGQGYLGFIPIPVVIMLLVFVIGWIYLNRTVHGRYIYGIGGNEEAIRLAGVNIIKMKYLVYMISGFLSALAGVILLSRLHSGQPRAGIGFEFDVVTAVVLGGVSIKGGEGKLSGVLVGVIIMGVLSNGLILLNVSEYYQMVIKGMVLLIAVGFDTYSKQRTDTGKLGALETK